MLFSLCQLKNDLTVYEFDTYFPDHLNLKEPEDWEIYSKKCRNIMLKAGNFKDTQSGYRDYRLYEEWLETQLN